MRKTVLLVASVALAVLLASGVALAQTTPPEHLYYEFAGKWSVSGPERIAVDSRDNIYVLAYPGVRKFTSDGTFVKAWSVECASSGIAVDSRARIYVTRFGGGLGGGTCREDTIGVQKFTSNGALLTQWGSRGTGDGQFRIPEGVAVDSQDHVFVVDSQNNRIQEFTSDGDFVAKWGSRGDADGRFNGPTDVATDSQDNVYVLEYSRVQKFASDGTFAKKWEGLNLATGIGTDSQDNVYVSDWFDDNSVKKFTPEGEFVTRWGSQGRADGRFNLPTDVAVGSDGHVYVTDHFNGRVQEFVEVPDTVAPKTAALFGPPQPVR